MYFFENQIPSNVKFCTFYPLADIAGGGGDPQSFPFLSSPFSLPLSCFPLSLPSTKYFPSPLFLPAPLLCKLPERGPLGGMVSCLDLPVFLPR